MPAQTEAVLGTTKLIRLLNTEYRLELFNGGGADGFVLTVNGESTIILSETLTDAQLQTAITNLSSFSVGDVAVSYQDGAAQPFLIEFTGDFTGKIVSASVGSFTGTLEGLLSLQKKAPAFVDSINVASAKAAILGASEDYAYVAQNLTNALQIVDISNPAALALEGQVLDAVNLQAPTAVEVNAAETIAYLSTYFGKGITVVNISNKAAPAILGQIIGDAVNYNLVTCIALGSGGIYTYSGTLSTPNFAVTDVTDPGIPVNHGSLSVATAVSENGVAVLDDETYAFLSLTAGSLLSIDLSNKAAPSLEQTISSGISAGGGLVLSLDNSTLFMTDTTENVVLAFDVSDPTAIVLIDSVQIGGDLAYPLFLSPDGKTLFAQSAGETTLYLVDISSPAAMYISGALKDPTNMLAVGQIGGATESHVFLGTFSAGKTASFSIDTLGGSETTIGSQVDSSETISNGKDEITNKQSPSLPGGGLAKEHILTDQEVTLDMSNIFTPSPGDAGQLAGKSAAQNLQMVQVVIYDSDAASREVWRNAIIQNLGENAAHNSARRQSWAIMRSGSSEFI